MDKYELFDSAFEEMLKSNLTELPPDDIVKNVTPFKKSLNRVFTGLAFSALTLNLWALNYILPFIGSVFSILGLRTLRKENKWFFGCYVITCIRAVRIFALLIVNSTIYSSSLNGIAIALTIFDMLLMLLFLLLLRKAIGTLQQKAGILSDTKRITTLILWYVLLCVLAFIEYTGFILGWGMIIGYIFIIRSLYKLSKETEDTGYAIESAPVRISDRALSVILTLTIAVCCLGGNLLFGRYEMKWEIKSDTEHAQVQQIKEHLISLGFPAHILEDMTAEEIKECEGATEIFTDVDEHPINKGRKVTKTYSYSSGNTYHHTSTVYDVRELRITGVAVKLPTERESWRLIHHFEWTVNPGFYGTESIQLWTQNERSEGWMDKAEATGRVLYSKDGVSYTAPYFSLGKEIYTYNSVFFGKKSANDTIATFSLPNKAERQRGYVTYEIKELSDGYIVDSWINYTHQQTPFQFPVRTAAETRMSNNLNESGAFRTIQDALQFSTHNGKAEGF
ncbi:MAG: hypothetical protein IJB74_03160 [Clostridia bacterium]|nr:hypothetical protein [Clostridia bacterium]